MNRYSLIISTPPDRPLRCPICTTQVDIKGFTVWASTIFCPDCIAIFDPRVLNATACILRLANLPSECWLSIGLHGWNPRGKPLCGLLLRWRLGELQLAFPTPGSEAADEILTLPTFDPRNPPLQSVTIGRVSTDELAATLLALWLQFDELRHLVERFYDRVHALRDRQAASVLYPKAVC